MTSSMRPERMGVPVPRWVRESTAPDALIFATTSPPYAEKLNAATLQAALSLPETLRSLGLREAFGEAQPEHLGQFAIELGQHLAAERLEGLFDVVELIAIIGYYCMVSVTLNAFEAPLPAGEPSPFPD